MTAAKYVLAAGLLMVIYAVVCELSLYMHKLEHTRHEKAMVVYTCLFLICIWHLYHNLYIRLLY
jgi:hypothetical protein